MILPLSPALLLAAVPAFQVEPLAPPQIVLDGDMAEWATYPPAITDPKDAPNGPVDLGAVKIAADAYFVDFNIEWGRTVTIQGLQGSILLLLDSDGNGKTGLPSHDMKGVDLVVQFTPPETDGRGSRGGGGGMGVGAFVPVAAQGGGPSSSKAVNIYDLGVTFAPTHDSDVTELRIERHRAIPGSPDTAPIFSGQSFVGKLVALDQQGAVTDQTDVFSINLPQGTARAAAETLDTSEDPLRRLDPGAVRVMSWNAELGKVFTSPEPFARAINAINPDVILFQELKDSNSAQQLVDFLQKHVKAWDKWYVSFGQGGGNLRCAVTSRWPLEDVEPVKLVRNAGNNRTIRCLGSIVNADGKRLLAVSVHLKCCGALGGSEDETRIAEAAAIQAAVQNALAAGNIDGVIVGGDFNLVGARRPLDDLCSKLDLDGSDLTPVTALQIDGRSNATWFDAGAPFVPGRLDYLLITDSRLAVQRAFIFESCDLGPKWRTQYGVNETDSRDASDHLPVVVDLAWK